jgi:hypothetical protein
MQESLQKGDLDLERVLRRMGRVVLDDGTQIAYCAKSIAI